VELDAEMVLQPFKYPGTRQPRARNNNPLEAGDEGAAEKMVGQAQENAAGRRRQLNEQADRMFFHLDDYGAERRRLVDERIARLRAAATAGQGGLAPENLDRRQIRARDRDEERLDRLIAEVQNANAAEPARGRNDAGDARRINDEFGPIFAHMVPGEPMVGEIQDGEARQPRGRPYPHFGRQQEDPPAVALRQHQILDHQQRNLQRSQQMARWRRGQENDEVPTARQLEILRRNNAAMLAAQPAIVLSDSPESEVLSTGDEADEADDEDDFEDEVWL